SPAGARRRPRHRLRDRPGWSAARLRTRRRRRRRDPRGPRGRRVADRTGHRVVDRTARRERQSRRLIGVVGLAVLLLAALQLSGIAPWAPAAHPATRPATELDPGL